KQNGLWHPICSTCSDKGYKRVFCTECNEVGLELDFIDGIREYFCPEHGFVCSSCKEGHSKNDIQIVETKSYCQECFDENFGTCDKCNEIKEKHELNYTDRESICGDCVVKCDDCSEIVSKYSLNATVDGNNVCDTCLGDYFNCDECNLYASVDSVNTTLSENYLCDRCFNSTY